MYMDVLYIASAGRSEAMCNLQGRNVYHSCMDTLTGGCLKQCNTYRGQMDSPKAHEASSQLNNQYQTCRFTGNELCQK